MPAIETAGNASGQAAGTGICALPYNGENRMLALFAFVIRLFLIGTASL
ncbi:MAG: hypothetical protein ACLQGV_01225 [Bryobacteraceae bacterium]